MLTHFPGFPVYVWTTLLTTHWTVNCILIIDRISILQLYFRGKDVGTAVTVLDNKFQ